LNDADELRGVHNEGVVHALEAPFRVTKTLRHAPLRYTPWLLAAVASKHLNGRMPWGSARRGEQRVRSRRGKGPLTAISLPPPHRNPTFAARPLGKGQPAARASETPVKPKVPPLH